MKSLLKLFVPAFALGLLSASLVRAEDQAAPPPPPPPGDAPPPGGPGGGGRRGGRGGMLTPEQQVQRLDAAVKLTDDQKAKVIEIYKKAGADAQALRGGGGGREEMMAKGQEIQKAAHDQIRALLTADQQTKFDAMPPPPMGGRGGRRGGAGGPGGGEAPPPPPAAPAT